MRRSIFTSPRHFLLVLSLLLAAAAVLQPPFVGAAQSHSRQVAASALGAYAVLRTINATISTAKEAEVSVPLVGALAAKPGMALDPIDETVARISDALFLIMAVTAVLGMAFPPLASMGAALSSAGFLGLWYASRTPRSPLLASTSRAAAFSGLVLALVLPISFAGGGWVARYATESRLLEATEDLGAASGRTSEADGTTPEPTEGQGGAWWQFWAQETEPVEEQARGNWFTATVEEYTARAGTIVTSSIDIIAIYALRLVVLPAIIFGLLLALLRSALPPPPAAPARAQSV